ncbi:MAG: RHS repeat-associated core domain-containing protein, partial [Planctomycetota bacterium]|nr:RHS repeat-associated core domain-containing protein [Planctomycetota bacterium]
GSVRDLVQYSAGTGTTSVVDHITYDTFGQIKGQTNSTWQPRFAYTGREWDADANLYQYCARWYDPRVGKFLSEDPLGFAAGDVNLSRYAGNTATVFVDPSGRFSGPPAGTPPTTTPADVTEQITKSNYRPRFIEQTPDLANDAAMQARMRIHHSLQQALADRYLAERGINVHDLVHLHGVDKTFHETVVNAMQRMFWEDMAKEYSKDGRVFTPTTVKAVVSLSGIDQCNQRLHDAFPGVFFRWGRPRR